MTGTQQRQAGIGSRRFPRPRPASLLRAHGAGVGTTLLASALVCTALIAAFMPEGWAHIGSPTGALNPGAPTTDLAGWQLALMFGAAAVFVAHFEVNAESHTLSLSEVPLILGLLFAAPRDLVAGRLVGEALALALYARQSPGKLAFNLSVFAAETSLAIPLYGQLSGLFGAGGPGRAAFGAGVCAAAFVAAAAAGQLGAAAVWTVIRLHGGRVRLTTQMTAAAITTAGNASLAVVAAVLGMAAPWALAPLLVVCAVVVAAYRSYATLSRRYGGLQTLYEFTTTTSGTIRRDETVAQVLDEARRLMRAGHTMALLSGPVGATQDSETAGRDWIPHPRSEPEAGHPAGTGDDIAAGWTLSTSRATRADGAEGPGALDMPVWLRERVLAGDTVLIPRGTQDRAHAAVLAHLQIADLVAAPLGSGDQVHGILLAADRLGDVNTFDADDALMLATLASQAAVALQNAGLVEQLHDQIQAREHDALHDALTGLPNRSLFLRSLAAALEGSRPVAGPRRTAVLLMDLNGFKDVNDTLGHSTGDRLLEQVASRLRRVAPVGATVARLGGDEFAVVVPDVGAPGACLTVAEHLGAALREPFTLDGLTLEIGAGIGVAVAPDHARNAATLLQRADVAMYAAKAAHLPATLYDPDADWHTQDRLRIAHELRRAIETGQITVAYQPIARARDEHVTGVEALARWDHPDLGPIGPDTFIAVAERTGLIHDLTWSVLEQSMAQARAWRSAGLDLVVNVNLSVQLLRDRDLPRKITELLKRHQVPAGALVLEITETGIMTDPSGMTRILEELVATGVSFAIDDFGTGHSSLTYLQRLPVTKVKIDKSFVTGMSTERNARAIVKSVIELAHNLDLHAVAEGVEDRRALDHLNALGCDFIQGYFLSRPIPAIEITEWLTSQTRRELGAGTARALRAAN